MGFWRPPAPADIGAPSQPTHPPSAAAAAAAAPSSPGSWNYDSMAGPAAAADGPYTSGQQQQAQQFSVLQQHISALEEEKFELKRGFELQARLLESLTNENQTLLEDFNRQEDGE